VFNFKSWKLNNGVFISFCTTSRIWNWHSISWLEENCVFSWCTCIPRIQEFDALVACYVVVSSPLVNKVRYSSMLRGWKDCGMTTRAPLAMVVGLKLDASPLV
jgi:hypothetical protein